MISSAKVFVVICALLGVNADTQSTVSKQGRAVQRQMLIAHESTNRERVAHLSRSKQGAPDEDGGLVKYLQTFVEKKAQDYAMEHYVKKNVEYYYIVELAIAATISILVSLVILWFFWHDVYSEKPVMDANYKPLRNGDFHEPLFGMANDWDSFAHLVCPCTACCRVTDTYVTAGIVNREISACVAASLFVFSFILCCSAPLLCLPFQRSQLRGRLGGYGGRWHPMDCVLVLLCFPCAAAQEARSVDRAVGRKTTTFCGLQQITSGGDVLGGAVRIRSSVVQD
eukprot:GEMP01044851.1.p1 GENE.GEMP01044851.1~~GEMP01044851.1.p1  ORF type:complete len:283 (+),score=46.18 GEMP01044851.1:352-1200(+)